MPQRINYIDSLYAKGFAHKCFLLCHFQSFYISQVDFIPPHVGAIDFNFFYTDLDRGNYRILDGYKVVNRNSQIYNHTITGLRPNATYTLKIGADGFYQQCSNSIRRPRQNAIHGNYSDPIIVSTNATCMFSLHLRAKF